MMELKPCPFCGSDRLYHMPLSGFYDETPALFCNSCKAIVTWEQVSEKGFTGKTVRILGEAWNTRAERTCRMLPGRPYYDMGEEGYTCSECGSWAKLDWVAHYCPNCGAKVVE